MFRVSSLQPTSVAALAALVASAAFAVGCAHETAAARHESDLRDGLSRMQSETDRLQLQGDDDAPLVSPRGSAAPGVFAAGDGGAKPLVGLGRTIQLGGAEGDAEDDDPNAPSARPKIELSGPPGAAARPRLPRDRDARDRVPPVSTGRARDTRIEMLGPVLETDGEPAVAVGPLAPAADAPPAEAAPKEVRPDPKTEKSEAPKNDAGKRRGSRDAQGREKPRPTDPKAPKETR
jgi:hypothetical protein